MTNLGCQRFGYLEVDLICERYHSKTHVLGVVLILSILEDHLYQMQSTDYCMVVN